jgi:hypothetical protein
MINKPTTTEILIAAHTPLTLPEVPNIKTKGNIRITKRVLRME